MKPLAHPRSRAVRGGLAVLAVGAAGLACRGAAATELVYTPVNPAFGGNPLNGSVLLNAAQAQNKHKDPDDLLRNSSLNKTPLQEFNDLLERSILNRLAGAVTGGVIGASGQLLPGTVQTANFTIQISDLGGGLLRITTTDKATGATASFEVTQ